MREVTIDFGDRLVDRFPNLKPIFDEHPSDNFREVLPHLIFGDLTRYAIELFIRSLRITTIRCRNWAEGDSAAN